MVTKLEEASSYLNDAFEGNSHEAFRPRGYTSLLRAIDALISAVELQNRHQHLAPETCKPALDAPRVGAAGPITHGRIVYTVVAGDELSTIAERFGVTAEQIALVNVIRNPDHLFEGWQLIIPMRDEKKTA